MKRQALMILTTLSLFLMLTATSVYAQSGTVLVANIPFEFTIENKAFPAGKYIVTYIDTKLMRIQSQDRSQSMLVFTSPVEARNTQSKLVFHRYEDEYFLSTLWTTGNEVGRRVRMSRSEREVIRARRALARSASEPQIVAIMLVGSSR